MIKNKTYRNFMIIMNRLINKGYNKEEALGNNPRILKSEKYDSEFYRNMWDTILAGAVWTGEIPHKTVQGQADKGYGQ